jgi:carbamoyl-phosphate synthase large subunit
LSETLPELVPPEIRAAHPKQKEKQLDALLSTNPLLFDRYLSGAVEVDVDALCDGESVTICGIMEHIEEAGIHSGDSACTLPPQSLPAETIAELERQTKSLALALNVGGLMNVQYAIKDGEIYVLEVNPRASRTVPFVAKAIGEPIAKLAARVMAGEKLSDLRFDATPKPHIAVKEAVFPFGRFPGVDTVLGPEMRSTGEVMGIDHDFAFAFAKSQLAAGHIIPTEGTVFVSVHGDDKKRMVEPVKLLMKNGFRVIATGGTQAYLSEQGLNVDLVKKVLEGRPNIVDAINNGEVQLVINTTAGASSQRDSRPIRQAALVHKVPYYTTVAGAAAAATAFDAYLNGTLNVQPLQDYFVEPA